MGETETEWITVEVGVGELRSESIKPISSYLSLRTKKQLPESIRGHWDGRQQNTISSLLFASIDLIFSNFSSPPWLPA